MEHPGHLALGTWSGGRFMHFGEPLDDERLEALLRPDAAIPAVITADAYGAGEADHSQPLWQLLMFEAFLTGRRRDGAAPGRIADLAPA